MRTGHESAARLLWASRLAQWVVVVVSAAVSAMALGVPTGVVRTSLYTRMTPVAWWDYPVWLASAGLIGLIAGTYMRLPSAAAGAGRAVGGGVASALAIGCPVCNKIVVALVGVGGALTYWAPLQPALAVLGLGSLVATLAVRVRGGPSCGVRVGDPSGR
jgi:hypothetical protein